ncbi:hypothetical protein ES707_13616 [subsurface metagenome]
MKTDERANTAKNLRQYRLVKGLKQKELAAKVGLSTDTISKIELGKQNNIGMKYLVSICRELDSSIEELFMADPKRIRLDLVVSDKNVDVIKAAIEAFKKFFE